MSAHPIIVAAQEFSRDEARREKRGQALRMPDVLAEAHLRVGLAAVESPRTPEGVDDPQARVDRGVVAVDLFGYSDTFDEQASTVITDILHAVAARGYSPQHVLDTAALYYAEERPHR